jgi:hypothetical protein
VVLPQYLDVSDEDAQRLLDFVFHKDEIAHKDLSSMDIIARLRSFSTSSSIRMTSHVLVPSLGFIRSAEYQGGFTTVSRFTRSRP